MVHLFTLKPFYFIIYFIIFILSENVDVQSNEDAKICF